MEKPHQQLGLPLGDEPSPPLHPPHGQEATQAVFDAWVKLFDPPRPKLTRSIERLLAKALAEASVGECIAALHGLKAYRASGHPGRTNLSAVFATYPGSSVLRDRIDFWIDQAEAFPSADPEKVALRKRDVEMGQMGGAYRRRAEEAEAWLREHGLATIHEPGQPPRFEPIR